MENLWKAWVVTYSNRQDLQYYFLDKGKIKISFKIKKIDWSSLRFSMGSRSVYRELDVLQAILSFIIVKTRRI